MSDERHPEVSLVIPVFNEQEALEHAYERIEAAMRDADVDYELLLVNDGSRDRSWEIMCDLRDRNPRVSLVDLSRNFGQQAAITAGMDRATGDAVVVMDADLQDPPEVAIEMIRKWREGFDVVYGVRSHRKGETMFKRASATGFYRLLRSMTPVDMPVDVGDFRLMSRRVVEALGAMPERNRYVRGMVAWLGFSQTGVVFARERRVAGRTKYPLRKKLRLALDGMVSFSSTPLKVSTYLGFLMALGCVLFFVYAVYMRFVRDVSLQGWTSIVASIVLLGAVQLICLGIIGEYIGRIYDEVKRRPLYLVQNHEHGPKELAEAEEARRLDPLGLQAETPPPP